MGSVNQAMSKSAVKGSTMLLTVSFAFIILTGPISIAYSMMADPPIMVYGITVILQYLNHSINGVLYCITGSRFRHELMKIFCCYGNETNQSTVYSMSHVSTSSVSVSLGVGHIQFGVISQFASANNTRYSTPNPILNTIQVGNG